MFYGSIFIPCEGAYVSGDISLSAEDYKYTKF